MVIILANTFAHRNRKIKEQRKIGGEDRGLFLHHTSPELNPAETLWRILKGKWIRTAITILWTRFSIAQTRHLYLSVRIYL